MIKLYHGDFLEKAKNIPDDSVDLVLTDPPYGTVKGMNLGSKKGRETYSWDEAIEPRVLFAEINRILRKNGKAVLFGQEPFTSRMITEAIPNLPFSYRMIWEKDRFAHGLAAKKAPVNYYEDVMVFSKEHGSKNTNPISLVLKEYQEKANVFWNDEIIINGLVDSGIACNRRSAKEIAKHKLNREYRQFQFLTKKQYNLWKPIFNWEHTYEELKAIDDEYKKEVASTFNIWEEEPVEDYEDILIFNKTHPTGTEIMAHPLREYFKRILKHIGTPYNHINERLGHRKAEHSFYVDNTQFKLCTKEVYEQLVQAYSLENMKDYKAYDELKKTDTHYKEQVASTFNLWQKKKSKSNILKYARDYPSLHPTMKPILLLEDLVKTFSNEGDLVVDLTMGSGSTGVACKNTGRSFIGIEMDDEYFNIAKERIESHGQQMELV